MLINFEFGSPCPYFHKNRVLLDWIHICTSCFIKKFSVFFQFAAINVTPHLREINKIIQKFQAVIKSVKK